MWKMTTTKKTPKKDKVRKTVFLLQKDEAMLKKLIEQTGLEASELVTYLLRKAPSAQEIKEDALQVLNPTKS